MPGWMANGTSASSRYDHSGSYVVVLQAGEGVEVLGAPPHAAEAELLDAAAGLRERVFGAGHRERGDADQVLGIGRAVLGDPVVERAAQRQRRARAR